MSAEALLSEAPASNFVPTFCHDCVAGPDLLTVRVDDGVATEIDPDFAAKDVHPGGKRCVKADGLITDPAERLHPNGARSPQRVMGIGAVTGCLPDQRITGAYLSHQPAAAAINAAPRTPQPLRSALPSPESPSMQLPAERQSQ